VVQENDRLKGEVRGLKLDTVVKGLMGKAGVRPERIDPLFRLTAERFDLTDDGDPMLKSSAKELDKYMAEDLKTEYPEFFQGSGSNGGGASKSNGGAGGAGPKVIGNTPAELMANIEGLAKGEVIVKV
jgi:hypothetical protein